MTGFSALLKRWEIIRERETALEEPIFRESRRGEAGQRKAVGCQPRGKGHGVSLPGDFQEGGISVDWVSGHLPQGRGRDQGLEDSFKRARMSGQTVVQKRV